MSAPKTLGVFYFQKTKFSYQLIHQGKGESLPAGRQGDSPLPVRYRYFNNFYSTFASFTFSSVFAESELEFSLLEAEASFGLAPGADC